MMFTLKWILFLLDDFIKKVANLSKKYVSSGVQAFSGRCTKTERQALGDVPDDKLHDTKMVQY